jgi:hypothetical protein
MSAHAAFHSGLLLIAVSLISGCAGAPADSPKALASKAALHSIDDEPFLPTPGTNDLPPVGLADLAQRDVDDFMRLQRAATEQSSEPTAVATNETQASTSADGALKADPPPAIIWTDPVGKTLAAGDDSADASDAETHTDFVTMGETTSEAEIPNHVLASPEPSLTQGSAADRMSEMLVGLSAELYMRASDADQPLRELIMITATSMVDPSRRLANIEALPGLTDREREMLTAFQEFFLQLGDKLDGSTEADAAITGALQTLQSNLVKAPALTVPNAALCTSVDGYGKYVPFSHHAFLAHASQQLVVYVEIDDFDTTQNKVGQWVTELAQQLVIYSDRDGIPVWREEWLPVVDTAMNPRNDFYTTQLITLPDGLSVGRYHLKIRLRDEHTGAEAEHSIEFEMVADPKLAAGRR